MAELFRHTDVDGDRIEVAEAVEIGGRMVAVKIGDEKGWQSAAYLDRGVALRLTDALLRYYGPLDDPEVNRG